MPFKATVSGNYASPCIMHQIVPPGPSGNSQQHSPRPFSCIGEREGRGTSGVGNKKGKGCIPVRKILDPAACFAYNYVHSTQTAQTNKTG